MEDATPRNGAPLEQAESAAKSGAESEELDSEDSELSSEEEDEVCSENNLHDVFLRQYNHTTNSDSGNKITPLGLKNCDKSQNIGNEKVTVMMNDAVHGSTFNDVQISHRKILAESDGVCSESLRTLTSEERSTGKDQDTHGGTGCVSDADGTILRRMKVENNDGVSKIPTVNQYEVGSNGGAIAGSSGASLRSRDGVQAVDRNKMLDRDDDAPNVGTGLLKIQVEDPLHGNKVKQEALDEEGSGSETDVETPNAVPGERIGNINVLVDTEAASSSHRPPFPLLQWLDQGARNHCNQKPSRAASSTAAAPSSGAGNFCGGDSSQMIRFLSEKISSALSGVTEDFLNRGQDAITEKISDALFDVYGLMQGKPGPIAAGAPVFPDSKQVTVKKPAAKRRFPDSKPVTAAKKRSTQVQEKAGSTKTSNELLKVDDQANEKVMDLTKSRLTRSAKKSYHCSKCDKAFSFSIQLKKHVCPFVDDDPVATATETSDDEDGNTSDDETEIEESEAEAPPKVAKKTKVEKKIWKCDKCGDVFPWKKGLTKHMRTHRPMKAQPEDKSYKCHCGKLYSSKASLQTHKHLNHGEMPYKCDYCLAGFVKIQHLRTHEKTAHPEEKKYECETCKKRFNDRRNFRQHQRIHGKRKQYVCEVCGKAYSHIKSLRVHRAIHTEGKKFSCNICGKGFVYKCYLAIHERIHTGLKPYVCQVCGKGFKASGALGIHERIHSGDKPYKCPVESCGKEFSQQSNLVIHERTHTGEKPYKCDICLKSFARGGDLVKHKDTHVVDKPFKCDYCPKSFSRKQLLTEHVRGHTGDKPYICQVCGKGFARCQSVVEHERIHTGVKPFACELCGKAFTYSSHLTIHRRTHSGERPYKCRYCTRTFTNISNRIKHERTHTGEKPYECRNCGKRFNVKGDMVRHEQTHGPVNYQKDQEPADYSRNIARREKAPVPVYEERVVVESDKPLPSFVEMGDTGYNPNSYMFQQL